jgi:thiamine pyrophosphokinase
VAVAVAVERAAAELAVVGGGGGRRRGGVISDLLVALEVLFGL